MNGRIPLPSPASRARKREKRLRSGHRFSEVGWEAGCNFSDVGLLGWVALRVYAAACLFCVAYEAVWPRTNGQFLTGYWLLFALFFKGLSSLAAFPLLRALQALPVNVTRIITISPPKV
jgi:hypothetical protein